MITGSYNWTKNATQNDENITIFTNTDVAFEYLSEFNKLLSIGGVKKEFKTILNTDNLDELPYSNIDLENDNFKKNIENSLYTAMEWIKKKDRFNSSLLINKITEIWPKDLDKIELTRIKHKFYLQFEKYVKSYYYFIELLDFYNSLPFVYENEILPIKQIYDTFVITTRYSDVTFDCYEDLNAITNANLYKFSNLNIDAYFYNYQTLFNDTLPF